MAPTKRSILLSTWAPYSCISAMKKCGQYPYQFSLCHGMSLAVPIAKPTGKSAVDSRFIDASSPVVATIYNWAQQNNGVHFSSDRCLAYLLLVGVAVATAKFVPCFFPLLFISSIKLFSQIIHYFVCDTRKFRTLEKNSRIWLEVRLWQKKTVCVIKLLRGRKIWND